MSLPIYGVYRERALSPGKVEADAAILDLVLAGLTGRGWEVGRLSADDLPAAPPQAALVLHLAQGPEALDRLEAWEARGLRLINPPKAVRRCYRRFLAPLLTGLGIPYPRTALVEVKEAEARWGGEFPGPGWLKRAEIHAETAGDVRRVASLPEAREVLADFRRRRIDALVWQEHVPGMEFKFYGVGPGRFFQAFAGQHEIVLNPAELAALSALAARAAVVVDLAIFGGDAILTPQGDFVLIDLNDWPSFSRCQEEAAQEIVNYVQDYLQP